MSLLKMTLNKININTAIKEVEALLAKEKNLSPALKAAIQMLVIIVSMFAKKWGLTSQNSSKPPSSDPNRQRGSNRKKSNKKPGGQKGRTGTRLEKVKDPDIIEELKLDKRKLPKGSYKNIGYQSRQVFELSISRIVTEYRAEILEDQHGKRFIAQFPESVTRDVQYGNSVKSAAVYSSQYQLIPYLRTQEQFADYADMPLSVGSIYNFNQEAYKQLENFEELTKKHLREAALIHADETGINVNKKRHWLHTVCDEKWIHFYPHIKRGNEATNEIGILQRFKGVMCHDHWKPYYKYDCTHSLCNAHHIRELRYAHEQDKQKWAGVMKKFLKKTNEAVNLAGGSLDKKQVNLNRERYRQIISEGEKECPEAIRKDKKKGRVAQTKSRNLLTRLRDFEDDTLRFMENSFVPFTNNLGERALRMTKVQQKISGCFRSIEGAYIFCRIRGYLSTCKKHDVKATDALRLLFEGKLPDFANDS